MFRSASRPNKGLRANPPPPVLSPLIDAKGNLYGATSNYSPFNDAIFELPAGSQSPITLLSYSGEDSNAGVQTEIELFALDGQGNLYGTESIENYYADDETDTIFKFIPSSSSIVALASVSTVSLEDLTLDNKGDIYYEVAGDSPDEGLFELPVGANIPKLLYSFDSMENLRGRLLVDASGDIFGIQYIQSADDPLYYQQYVAELTADGSFFRLSADLGGGYSYEGSDIGYAALLSIDDQGDIFGSTTAGGQFGFGSIFEITAGSLTAATVASFDYSYISHPEDGPPVTLSAGFDVNFRDAKGAFYGVSGNQLFEVSPGASSPITLTTFGDDTNPLESIDAISAEDAEGDLYITTSGEASGTTTSNSIDELELSQTSTPAFPVDLYTAAKLSADVYSSNPQGADGFKLIASDTGPTGSDLGYRTNVYASTGDNTIIIAVRGTDPTDGGLTLFKNLAADVSFGGTSPTTILTSEVGYVSHLLAAYSAAFPYSQIILTGHSLGGAVAQLVGAASGVTTYAFNAPGASQLLPALSSQLAPVAGLVRFTDGINANYRIYGDQVSLFGLPFGPVVTFQKPSNVTFTAVPGTYASDVLLEADLMLNGSSYLTLHASTLVVAQLEANAPEVSASGEPDDADAIEDAVQTSLYTPTVNGGSIIEFLTVKVVSGAAALWDPTPAADFSFTEQSGSPFFASIDLPALAGVSDYQLRTQSGGTWSSGSVVQDGQLISLPAGTSGIDFSPLDGSGAAVNADVSLFDLSFASSGTFSGSLTETPAADAPAWLSAASLSSGDAVWSSSTQTLTVTGPATIVGDPASSGDAPDINVTGAGDLMIDSALSPAVHIAGLSLSDGGVASMSATSTPDVLVIAGGAPSIDSTSSFDLGKNLMDLQDTTASQATATMSAMGQLVASGYQNGAWLGGVFTSLTAASDTAHLTAIAAVINGGLYGTGPNTLGTFDSVDPGMYDILVKYTYYGDANLDGKVDGSDYSLIDNGYLNHLTGWYNGNFNYDGVVNGSDYTLIDNAFNTQGASLAALISPPMASDQATIAAKIGLAEVSAIGDEKIVTHGAKHQTSLPPASRSGDFTAACDLLLGPRPPRRSSGLLHHRGTGDYRSRIFLADRRRSPRRLRRRWFLCRLRRGGRLRGFGAMTDAIKGATTTARIYVASLADYNSGNLLGRWIDASQSAEAVHAEIQSMLAESKEPFAEEWAIHDYEGFGGVRLSEYESIDLVCEFAAALEEHGEVFGRLVRHLGDLSNLEEAKRCMEEGPHGAYRSVEDYAEEFVEDCYGDVLKELPDFIRYHIDYEGIARDLELSGDIFSIECNGQVHIFSGRF